jgi:SagB-type dehydrogenase family enzyme
MTSQLLIGQIDAVVAALSDVDEPSPFHHLSWSPTSAWVSTCASRQELDAYLGVLNVDGVEPGFYHYNIRDHALELRSAGLTAADTVALCANQDWAGGAAFLVVLAAILDRMSSKYRNARCYRVSLLNAAHLGQTFALTATALGLDPAQTGAFCDTPLAERCRLDNTGTIPLYVLATGWPHPQPRHAPPPARLDTFTTTTLSIDPSPATSPSTTTGPGATATGKGTAP